jgi:hypothetical protein
VYSDRWSPGLRQGDVLGEIPFPLPTKQGAQFVSTPGTFTGYELFPAMVLVQAKMQYVAVVSHDCEFNEDKRKHFLVAKVEPLPHELKPEELEALRSENDIQARGAAALDTFFLDPIDGVFDRPRRINFCTVTPFPTSSAEQLISLKKAELDQPTRILLRTKLGYFFSRDAEDIPDEKKADAPPVIGG